MRLASVRHLAQRQRTSFLARHAPLRASHRSERVHEIRSTQTTHLRYSMSKRAPAASSTPSPRKRKALDKNAGTQPSLDTFFAPRAAASSPSPAKAASSTAAGRSGPSGATIASASASHDLAADEAFARRLAEEDGIDIHMLQRMETSAKKAAHAGPSKAVTRTPPEIIDVDLFEPSARDASTASSSASAGQRASKGAARSPEVSVISESANTVGRASSSLNNTLAVTEGAGANVDYPPLDVDPVGYSLDACPWKENSAAPYSFLAHALATLSGTRSRIAIMNVLTNTLRTIIKYHPASLRPTLYLLSNSLSPPYSPIELGLGPSILSKAIQEVSGLTSSALRRLYNSTGDPGELHLAITFQLRDLMQPSRGRRVRG